MNLKIHSWLGTPVACIYPIKILTEKMRLVFFVLWKAKRRKEIFLFCMDVVIFTQLIKHFTL